MAQRVNNEPGQEDPSLTGDFHDVLRLAITRRGLSLARLRAHLEHRGVHVGLSTLSYWQRGIRHPEVPKAVPAVRALESVLGLPAGALVTLIGQRPARARGDRTPPSLTYLHPDETGPAAERLLNELGDQPSMAYNAALETMFVHDTCTFDAQQREQKLVTRLVTRARRTGPDRYVMVYNGDDGCRIEDVTFRTGEGCRTGRIRRRAGEQTLAVELLFDRRLAEGDIHVFSYEVHDSSGGVSPGYHRIFRYGCPAFLLQLQFDALALPARCTRQFRPHGGAQPSESEDLPCDVRGVTSAFFRDPEPGLAGVAVEWT